MKFKLSLVTFLLIITLVGCSKEEPAKDVVNYFNGIEFSDTIEEVKAQINKTPYEEETEKLVYEDTLYGYNALIMYVFGSEKLKDVFVSFTDKYDSQSEYQARYDILKGLLTTNFGEKNLSEIKDNCSIWNLADRQILLKMDDEYGTSVLYSKK